MTFEQGDRRTPVVVCVVRAPDPTVRCRVRGCDRAGDRMVGLVWCGSVCAVQLCTACAETVCSECATSIDDPPLAVGTRVIRYRNQRIGVVMTCDADRVTIRWYGGRTNTIPLARFEGPDARFAVLGCTPGNHDARRGVEPEPEPGHGEAEPARVRGPSRDPLW